MLTGESIDEAQKSCRNRFGARFTGFAPIPLEIRARSKWSEYRQNQISRTGLELWLKSLNEEDERSIRALYNGMQGR